MTLHSVFVAFFFILKCSDTIIAHEQFDKIFFTYRQEKDHDNMASEERDKLIEQAREKLAKEEIRPFLQKFVPFLSEKKNELIQYLVNESKSDSEIVSII